MKILILASLLLLSPLAHADVAPLETVNCSATREFVTALEFLRADEDFRLKEPEGRELAFKIAEGCTGSAKRFIRISKALSAAGANRKDATATALKFSSGTDAETDAFTTVFRKALAEDSLDLDFDASLKIALSLSKEFAGDLKKVRDDFDRVVDYCSDSKNLGLVRDQCGAFAASIAKAGQHWKEGVSAPFIDVFQYLRSDSGPSLITSDALKIAEMLVTQGPGAPENFKQAYQYATANSGLALTREDAIKFAKKMAAIDVQKVKTDKPEEGPAKANSH